MNTPNQGDLKSLLTIIHTAIGDYLGIHRPLPRVHSSKMATIVEYVANDFDVATDFIDQTAGKNREMEITEPRHIAEWLCRKLTAASYQSIARHFNCKDHNSVMHGVKRCEELRSVDKDFRDRTNRLLEDLRKVLLVANSHDPVAAMTSIQSIKSMPGGAPARPARTAGRRVQPSTTVPSPGRTVARPART